MIDIQFVPRELTEEKQLDLALKLSQYNNLDKLLLNQHDNYRRLNEAKFFEIENEVADAQVMAKVLEKAIKFSIH